MMLSLEGTLFHILFPMNSQTTNQGNRQSEVNHIHKPAYFS